MRFHFINKAFKWGDVSNGRLTLNANGLNEAIELLKLMVARFEDWELHYYE